MTRTPFGAPRCEVTNKVRYDDKQSAKRRARATGQKLSPYPCAACHGWHLGHLSPGIVAGKRPRPTRDDIDGRIGMSDHVVRSCPACGAQGTVAVGFLHARTCATTADPRTFPRLT